MSAMSPHARAAAARALGFEFRCRPVAPSGRLNVFREAAMFAARSAIAALNQAERVSDPDRRGDFYGYAHEAAAAFKYLDVRARRLERVRSERLSRRIAELRDLAEKGGAS